jgi:cadmium resistance protein CadD (predicted permease)
LWIRVHVITKLPNSEQSYKAKVKTHKYINRQNQSTTGKLWHIYKVRHTICVYVSGDGIYTCCFFFINLTAIFVSIFNYLLDDFSYHALSNKRQPYHHISHLISKVSVVVVNVWYLDLQLIVQSVPITTKDMSSNHAHGELYIMR